MSEIGGKFVEPQALLRGTEDPHFVDAVPEFTRLVAAADVVCIVGLDLEVGYMPPVLRRSGNAKVQPGGPGYCEVGKAITILEKPTGPVDRSMGDVHPHGNPHFYLSPTALAEAARVVVSTLSKVDARNATQYHKQSLAFIAKMQALRKKVADKLAPLHQVQKDSGKAVVMEYHREFAYFFHEYGLKSFGSVEEKPGVPPSAGRLARLAGDTKAANVKVVLASIYNPAQTLKRFSELSGIPVVVVPTMMQQSGPYREYSALQEHLADALVGSLGSVP